MVMRTGGFRKGTRFKLKKGPRQKGKISLRNFLQRLEIGQKVQLVAEPAYQRGMYFPRFHGKFGTIRGRQGECYNVAINDHKNEKILVIHPIHLKKVMSEKK